MVNLIDRQAIYTCSMRDEMMKRTLPIMSMMILVVLATGTVSIAQDMPSEYQQVLTFLGKQGD